MEQENKRKRFGTIMKCVSASRNKFIGYVNENSEVFELFPLFLGVAILLTLDDPFAFIIGIVVTTFSFFTGLDIILRKKYNNDILTGKVNIVIDISLIIVLFPQLSTINPSSASSILISIVIFYSLQNILYSFFIFLWKNVANETDAVKRYNATHTSISMIVILLFLVSFIDFSFFKILLLFFVYGLSSLIREKYLIESVKSDLGVGTTFKRSVFSNVASINNLTSMSLLLIFLLFYSDVFAIDSQSILYFYSTTAQVFAALLGIIVMFSILILQKDSEKDDGRKTLLKKGLVGFTILYILIIMFSNMGIVLNNLDYLNSEKLPENLTTVDLKGLLSVSIFEFVILMIPMGLLYLYAMISDFLEWDATFETKMGQGLDASLLRKAEGANKVIIKTTED